MMATSIENTALKIFFASIKMRKPLEKIGARLAALDHHLNRLDAAICKKLARIDFIKLGSKKKNVEDLKQCTGPV
jgi:hypothetical protein